MVVDNDYQIEDIHEMLEEISETLTGTTKSVKCDDPENLEPHMFMKMTKEKMSHLIVDMADTIRRSSIWLKKTSGKVDELKNELIDTQKWDIRQKKELLDAKEAQLQSFQTTVKTEMKSYCAAFTTGKQITSQESLKEAMKSVVQEEDRSKNLMLFGVKEEETKGIEGTVAAIFESVDEKPQIEEVVRVGKPVTGGPPRPIKVSLRSAMVAMQILRNAKRLKESTDFGGVFISPDRSREERIEHKKLVEQLRAKQQQEPSSYHYIWSGVIYSKDRTTVQKSDHAN